MITVYVASAFSKDQQGGNKAGVVLDAPTLTTNQKMEIAKELGYAETAFVSTSKVADFKLEYYTPEEEVDLCGHATIATFVVLTKLNLLVKEKYLLETNSGTLTIDINENIIYMQQTQPVFSNTLSPSVFSNCFDINLIDSKLPIQIVSTGLRDILIPIKSYQSLHSFQPNFNELSKISREYDVIGAHLYTIENERIICRNFAPLYGINEEAATGTSNGALACLLYTQGIKKNVYRFEQGYSLNAPSEILVHLQTNENRIEKVYVGGQGYFCETKKLCIQNDKGIE